MCCDSVLIAVWVICWKLLYKCVG